jgi:PTS system nitrogen regulatory IIA component
MNLAELIKLETCNPDLQAKTKDEVLFEIATLLHRCEELKEIEISRIYDSLQKREALGSTGFSRSIAIPHCQIAGLQNFIISLSVSKKGISFDALDKKKSRIFVTIVGPEDRRNEHIQILATCSHILKEPGVIDNLIQSNTKISLYEEFLRNASNNYRDKSKRSQEKLLLLIVKDDAIIQDITEVFLEYGVEDSTIVDTQQMQNLLSKVPLFLGFFNFTGEKSAASKIILAKIEKDRLNAIIQGLEDIFGDLDSFSDLSLLALDIHFSKGF